MADKDVNIAIKTTKKGDAIKQSTNEMETLEDVQKRMAMAGQKLERIQAVHDRTQRRFGEGSAAAAKSQRNLGMATLEASRAFEDMQYGLRGALNNIPGLVQMLGAGAGLAGVISTVAVAASILGPKILELLDPMEKMREAAKKNAEESKKVVTELGKSAAAHDKAAEAAKREEENTAALTASYQELARALEDIDRIKSGQEDAVNKQEQQTIERLKGAAEIEKKRVDAGEGRYANVDEDGKEAIKARIDKALEDRIAAASKEASVSREAVAKENEKLLGGQLGKARDTEYGIRVDQQRALPESEKEALLAERDKIQATVQKTLAEAMTQRAAGNESGARDSDQYAQSVAKRGAEINARLKADEELADKYGGDIAGALAQAEAKVAELETKVAEAIKKQTEEKGNQSSLDFQTDVLGQTFDLEGKARANKVAEQRAEEARQAAEAAEKQRQGGLKDVARDAVGEAKRGGIGGAELEALQRRAEAITRDGAQGGESGDLIMAMQKILSLFEQGGKADNSTAVQDIIKRVQALERSKPKF